MEATLKANYKTRSNIFVSISKKWRIAIILYILIWELIPEFASTFFLVDNQPYVVPNFILSLINEALLLLPFFIKRIGPTPIGWLHPLILPTLLSIASTLATSPASLINPFTILFQGEVSGTEDAFLSQLGISNLTIAEGSLQLTFLNLLSTILLYAGFIVLNFRVPRIAIYSPHQLQTKLILILSICLFSLVWVIQTSGGFADHMTSLAFGRHRALSNLGLFMVLIGFAPYLMIIWFIFEHEVIKTIRFWSLFMITSVMQFVAGGSRSSSFFPFIILLAVWIFYNRKIPITRILALALAIFLLIGPLGNIRQSARDGGRVDFSSITDFNLAQAVEQTQEDLESRRESSASLAIMTLVPDRVDHLWGRTYISAIAFWIPRTIWSDKPRGGGAHVGALIFGGRETEQGYAGGGTPPGAVAEAYWNFSVPGIVLVFFFFGGYLRWLTNLAIKKSYQPAIMGFYIVSMTSFTSPTTVQMVPYLQTLVLLTAFYVFIGVIRVRFRAI